VEGQFHVRDLKSGLRSPRPDFLFSSFGTVLIFGTSGQFAVLPIFSGVCSFVFGSVLRMMMVYPMRKMEKVVRGMCFSGELEAQ
jgi:hypothetical protein